MTIIDANLLLYAYNADAPQQRIAARWLAQLLGSGEMIAMPWVTLWAFIRIGANSRIRANPRPLPNGWHNPASFRDSPDRFTRKLWRNSSLSTAQPVHW